MEKGKMASAAGAGEAARERMADGAAAVPPAARTTEEGPAERMTDKAVPVSSAARTTDESSAERMTDEEVVLGYRAMLREARLLEAELAAAEADTPLTKSLAEARRRKLSALTSALERFEGVLNRVKSPRARLILRSYYGSGLTDAAIGEALDMSTRRVNSLRHLALVALKEGSGAA